jgi:hypothetical protein
LRRAADEPGGAGITFDEPSGRLQPTSSPEAWVLCPHLRPILGRLLHEGPARIVGATAAWTRTDLAVTLDRGPSEADLAARWLPSHPDVEAWKNDDSHYAVEFGVRCPACRHAISWPQG